jgi:CRISPR/Cas system-associated exonuclease Cas4 (RecB family)
MSRILVNRNNMDTLPIYACLNRGSKNFRSQEFILKLNPRENRERITHVRMSQIGTCARLQWYRLHDPDEIPDEDFGIELACEKLRIFHAGDIYEAYIIELFRRGGWVVEEQQREVRDPDLRVVGHIDGLLSVRSEQLLLELKALKHETIENLAHNKVLQVTRAYYDQMQYYMFALRQDRFDIKRACFVAYDKDNSQFYVELVEFNEQYAKKFLRNKALNVLTSDSVKTIPELFITRDCDFCPLRHACRDDIDGIKEFEARHTKKKQLEPAKLPMGATGF